VTHIHDAPARWLIEHAALLPRSGLALDVACGRGRHARWLAERGFSVRAIDRNAEAIAALRAEAARLHLAIEAAVVDLETGPPPLEPDRYDVIVVVHYLHRPLFPALVAALRPGGVLVYETFTRAQAERGKPTNPAFLLEPGELGSAVQPLTILEQREGVFDDRAVASIVAMRPPAGAGPA
jgi:SAM-dependent methyltransferase